MSKTITEIPYSEIIERVMALGRVNSNAIEKVRGIIQDIYTHDIPTKYDWTFLIASSSITTTEEYKTGNVSVNTGSQIASFSTDATMAASMVGRKIKFTGNDVVYDVNSFMAAQSIQILPPFQGGSNISNGSYTIFQPVYALAPDFDRFPKDGGVYKWQGGSKKILPEEPYQEYAENFSGTPSIPDKIRLVGIDTAGNQLIEFRPAPKNARIYSYDYLQKLYPLQEGTAGLIKGISSRGISVVTQTNGNLVESVGSDSKTLSNLFFRVDVLGKGQDSQWYPVINLTSNSDLTLRTAFANTAVTTANYTVSHAPHMPSILHPAILYASLAHIMADQSDETSTLYMQRASQIIQEAKRLYVSRTYSQDIHGIHEDWNYRR